MKKTAVLLIIALSFGASEMSAQKWLDKLSKGIDNASKSIDKALNEADKVLGVPAEQASATAGYETATIKNFSASVDFVIESCIADGKVLILNFTLQNKGKDVEIRTFGSGVNHFGTSKDKSAIIDELGNSFGEWWITVGTETGTQSYGTDFILPEGVKVKGSIIVGKFDSRAKTLQRVNLVANIYDGSKPDGNRYTNTNAVLRNVPVYSVAQILGSDKILFQKQNPAVENYKSDGCIIKSVVVTQKNTQVNFTCKSGMYIYVGSFANTYISSGNINYALTAAYGIATDKRQYSLYSGGSEQNFTLVFEPIKLSETIDVIFDNWKWTGVRLLEQESLKIPKINSVMNDVENLAKFDAKYKTQMSAAERTKYQITKIQELNPDTKIFFGKEIYKDDKCRFVTLLYRMEDETESMLIEYLVSYDSKGNYVDALMIGNMSGGGDFPSIATIEDDRLYHSEYGSIYYHKITNDLHFIQIEKEDY
jgi:hypothetical protein